ncbi:MAG: DUF4340 domain-containing protein [Gemmatimonadetes bacterium]|nr:DUF4340 domain-containing protein [Gemmatimonadota bacterium]
MMSRKSLLILTGVLLVVIVLSQVTGKKRYRTEADGGFVDIVDASFDPASVAKITAWLGTAEDEPVVLEREGDGWAVTSRWGWTAKADLVKRLLDDLTGLQGEKRSSKEDVLADYQTDDENGLHILAEGTGGSEIFHLVAGKTAVRGGGFVRHAGSSDVYKTPSPLRSSFGVWGDENSPPKPPDPKRWIELRVNQADRLDVESITIRDGSREIALVKEIEMTEPAADDTTAAEPVPDRTKWEWKPDASGAFDKGKADNVMNSLISLYAFDVADPDSLEAYGLTEPERSVTVAIENGDTVDIFFGVQDPEDDKKTYFRVGADGLPALIYTSTVDRIFQKRSDLSPDA